MYKINGYRSLREMGAMEEGWNYGRMGSVARHFHWIAEALTKA
jgi:hypothetical protein